MEVYPGKRALRMTLFLSPPDVSRDSRYEAFETADRSSKKYMTELEKEFAFMPVYRKLENEETEKELLKSRADPKHGLFVRYEKRGRDI